MQNLADKKCALHQDREAAGLCLECGNCFCRECLTEHQGRVVCSQCLSVLAKAGKDSRFQISRLSHAFQLTAAILILWMFFFYAGRAIIAIPSSFHEGTLWRTLDLE